MRDEDRRRVLIFAVLVSVAIGFLLGWFGRIWIAPSPESRARDRMEQIRDRARELTR